MWKFNNSGIVEFVLLVVGFYGGLFLVVVLLFEVIVVVFVIWGGVCGLCEGVCCDCFGVCGIYCGGCGVCRVCFWPLCHCILFMSYGVTLR